MKPLFSQLKANHYSSNRLSPDFVSSETVYSEIGYDYHEVIRNNPAFENTCAIRMSLALLKCNVAFSGRFLIKAGALKGKKIEPGAKLLADQLYTPNVFGKAEIFTDLRQAGSALKNRKGIIFFHQIAGYGGGHMDLLEPQGDNLACHSACFVNCKEMWFWEFN
ncbi:MAG: T6SS effector amidase Tae4 family protein [Gibbsiella quercinecans]|uniref:T6SS effector amidase Tae4 family protein n=1 Tax=Gibbsiella quercinecans TaxID=929813 RepID=UPI000EF13C1A|nr:T6SS effector amidase Tae4 family protein [Gibbsiella quercinecans]RLM02819.1 hypothetical protein BIY31_22860 [Gibbsiella quercinecans]